MSRFRPGAALILAIVGVSSATAQVAPPPPPAPAPEPEYTAPELPAPRPADRPRTPPQPKPERGAVSSIPEIPYESLAVVGEDGKIIQLRSVLDLDAMRVNPTIGPARLNEVMGVLVARRSRFEEMVIQDLDLVLQIDGGLVDTVRISDIENMQLVANVVKPLVPPTSVTQELRSKELLTRVQAGFNEKIVKEYQQKVTAELRAQGGEIGNDLFLQFLLREPLKEPLIAYNSLLLESQLRMEQVVQEAEITGDTRKGLMALAGPIGEDLVTQDEQLDQLKELLAPLPLATKQAFLRQVVETREEPKRPPIPVVDMAGTKQIKQGMPNNPDAMITDPEKILDRKGGSSRDGG